MGMAGTNCGRGPASRPTNAIARSNVPTGCRSLRLPLSLKNASAGGTRLSVPSTRELFTTTSPNATSTVTTCLCNAAAPAVGAFLLMEQWCLKSSVSGFLRRRACSTGKILSMAKESPISKDLAPVSSGTHGCIDCVIGECHKCLCNAALKWGSKKVAHVVDPNNKARNQYLVCEGTRITCHPCPKGLVFNCRRGVCATTGECPSIPAKCHSSCPVSTTGTGPGSKLGLQRYQTSIIPTKVIVNPVVTTAGLTQRQCACKMALKSSTSGSSSAYACDPYLQQNYLICQDDGTFESKTCPVGKAWNYAEKTCSDKMRKCRPLLATCSTM